MANYIDGFALPIPKIHLNKYKNIVQQVADIWKEHGAIAYYEFVGDDLQLEGTRSFVDAIDAKEDEVIIFGWVVFESKVSRDIANKKVPADPRMEALIAPLTESSMKIFDANRMVYGGFRSLLDE